jgi:S-adenosylmethionine:tRNA ribosyltransferase-isomerase
MNLSDFDYILPQELIAQYPVKERDAARLMVVNRKEGTIEDMLFKDITHYLCKDDLLVLNDTRVVRARLFGARHTGGKVEILLLHRKKDLIFNALIRPGRIKLNEKISFNNGKLYGRLTAKNEITFDAPDIEEIYAQGVIPLPPYIKRLPEDLDKIYYQTVYARQDGSIAAPTAGLHFTEDLIAGLKPLGVHVTCVTLHVGYGTFKPVKADDITQHTMEPEYFHVPDDAARVIEETRLKGKRIIGVGTTALRSLETYAAGAREGTTNLFVYPGYKFKIVDCLLTNFHLPRTTLFMLACAFGAAQDREKLIKDAYRLAIERKYRFYSYGDAMLIV